MSNRIEDIQKQTFRYYYEDGLVELAVGILFAVIGFNTWLVSIAPKGTPLAIAAWVALPVLTIGGIFFVQRFVKNLKERLVYPRTGYIAYDTKPNPYRWLVMVIPMVVIALAILFPDSRFNRESVMGGILLCVILVSIGAQVKLRRLIAIGIFGLVLGISMAFLPGSEHAGLSLTYAGAGLALLFTGSIAWRKYLAENPQLERNREGAND